MACTDIVLPKVKADYCDAGVHFGQIQKIRIGIDGSKPADWTSLADWEAVLDNDDTVDPTKIRTLNVIGDKPKPEQQKKSISLGRTIYTGKKHTVNIKVDDVEEDNYNFVKWLEDNVGSTLRVWYETEDFLYGGEDGILATLSLDDIIPESKEDYNVFEGTVSWDGKHPDRIVNPLS